MVNLEKLRAASNDSDCLNIPSIRILEVLDYLSDGVAALAKKACETSSIRFNDVVDWYALNERIQNKNRSE